MAKLYVQAVVQWTLEPGRGGYRSMMAISVEGEDGRPIEGLDTSDFSVYIRGAKMGWQSTHSWGGKGALLPLGWGKTYVIPGFYELRVLPPFFFGTSATYWDAWMLDDSVFLLQVKSGEDFGQAFASNFTPPKVEERVFYSIINSRIRSLVGKIGFR